MKNYFNAIICNNGLWIALRDSNLESLLEKAKELEKKYEWLQAAESYQKASEILFEEKNFVKAAELAECFCNVPSPADSKKSPADTSSPSAKIP